MTVKTQSKGNVSREVKASSVMSAFSTASNSKLTKGVAHRFTKAGTNQTENPKRPSVMTGDVQ